MSPLVAKIEKFAKNFNISPRETEIIHQLVSGNIRSDEIAKVLGISPNTVRIHIKNINLRVGVNSKAGILTSLIRFWH